ncbi:carboxymuconolactone decarboxylase family protein [Nocardiopsis sp. MG754419]|uniref:carboxymuconolactone decarboxylase family protein n=1 Tax=Nocardiopsis sp. MG754419 TaxID=2259865 RepID=UPI001BAAA650|nr:carboxymuconolactone decarboxylase family protein [Nocardiopsis sp. MG754419]MBR8742600.1 carboxymuconolactone decarboxylase family protein [Nocardiopsis sp. MG754419]
MTEDRVVWAKKVPQVYKKLDEIDHVIAEHLDVTLLELVKLRSSVLNGCAFCVDLHTRRALKEGETEQRLFLVSTWYEAGDIFTPRERAALALTDEMTRLGEHGVSDATYAATAEHFDETEIAALMSAIAMINLYNRLAVTSRLHTKKR